MTKLEQVARAIALSNGVNPDSLHPNKLGDEIKSGWEWHLPQARAAVGALRDTDLYPQWNDRVEEILNEKPDDT